MNNVEYGFFALTTALITAGGASAATFSILGIKSYVNARRGTTGQLRIEYDPAPEGNITFRYGGLRLKVESFSNPQVIKFTGGTIVDAQARWNFSEVLNVTTNSVGELNAYSYSGPGLPAHVVSTFAVIDYEVIGCGTTFVSLGVQGEDPLFDGNLSDVSNRVQLYGLFLSNYCLPEPGSIVLATIGIAAIALRRRNG